MLDWWGMGWENEGVYIMDKKERLVKLFLERENLKRKMRAV